MSRTESIELSFPNGEKWRVKAYPIAVTRAYLYVELDKNHPDYDQALNDEIDYALCMEGFDDLMYFIENQMEWNELEKTLIPTRNIKPDYNGWLVSGEFYVKAVMSND